MSAADLDTPAQAYLTKAWLEELNPHLDAQDIELLLTRGSEFLAVTTPSVGHFVRLADGSFTRLAVNHKVRFQGLRADPKESGAFFLYGLDADFSGWPGLDPIYTADLTHSDEYRLGDFWFFHHAETGAGRRVNCRIPVPVFNYQVAQIGYC